VPVCQRYYLFIFKKVTEYLLYLIGAAICPRNILTKSVMFSYARDLYVEPHRQHEIVTGHDQRPLQGRQNDHEEIIAPSGD
jgi:hypothetical protein